MRSEKNHRPAHRNTPCLVKRVVVVVVALAVVCSAHSLALSFVRFAVLLLFEVAPLVAAEMLDTVARKTAVAARREASALQTTLHVAPVA